MYPTSRFMHMEKPSMYPTSRSLHVGMPPMRPTSCSMHLGMPRDWIWARLIEDGKD